MKKIYDVNLYTNIKWNQIKEQIIIVNKKNKIQRKYFINYLQNKR